MSWVRRWTGPLAIVLLIGLFIESWYPFRFVDPWIDRHGPRREADGSLSFDGRSALASNAPLPALAAAGDTTPVLVQLEARSAASDQQGPARLLSISGNIYGSSLVVAQQGDDLLVRVSRPAAAAGTPEFKVRDLFADRAWHRIQLTVAEPAIVLRVDERTVVSEATRAPLHAWERTHLVGLGDEALGDRGWRGSLRRAELQVGDQRIDLRDPAVLHAMDDVVQPLRLQALFHLKPYDSWWITAVRLIAFAAVSAAVLLCWPRWSTAAALLAVPFLLTAGKVFVTGRDPTLADSLVGAAGVLLAIALRDRLRELLHAARRRGGGLGSLAE